MDSNEIDAAVENLVSYRLKKVEEGVSSLNNKLDKHIEIEAVVAKHSFQIDALYTSRNRMLAWVSGASVASVAALLGTVIQKVS